MRGGRRGRQAAIVMLSLGVWLPAEASAARTSGGAMPTLGGTVWADADRNGVRGQAERVVRGAKVVVQRARKAAGRTVYGRVAARTTGRAGTWSFRPRKGGRYRARVLLPRGYAGFAAANRGRRESRDSDVSARGGLTPTVRLARGGKARRFDAGLLPARAGSGQPAPSPSPGAPAPTPEPEPQPQPPGPPFQIAGLIWRDDGDGIRQTDELARREGTVELWTADRSTMLASTTTNGFGGWTLTVPGGVAYRVRVIENGSYKSFAPKRQGSDPTRDSDFNWAGADKGFTDVIPADAGSMHFDAAAMTPVNIGNLVWRDLNANGIQDAGESGVANVTVELWDATRTELLDSVVSDASGNYFVKAPCGGQWYRIRVVPPIGAGFAPKDQGGNDQLDSDIHVAGPEAGWTDVVPIASNVISTTIWDAGLVPAP